jgi:Uma2 family endonuclease
MLAVEQLVPETVRPLSRAEYDRMVELGFFADERIELLRGMLVTMSPQGADHAEVVRRLTELLVLALQGRATVSPQCPFAALDDSEPEPDIALIPRVRSAREHPTEAFLIVEVAWSSLRKDRLVKAAIYAENGAREYWVVDLAAEEIEVYTEPRAGRYAAVSRHARGATIALVAFPDLRVAVDDVLPPRASED